MRHEARPHLELLVQSVRADETCQFDHDRRGHNIERRLVVDAVELEGHLGHEGRGGRREVALLVALPQVLVLGPRAQVTRYFPHLEAVFRLGLALVDAHVEICI